MHKLIAVLPLAAAVFAACEHVTPTAVSRAPSTPTPSVRAALVTGVGAMSRFQVCSVGYSATYHVQADMANTASTPPLLPPLLADYLITVPDGACEVVYTGPTGAGSGGGTVDNVTITATYPVPVALGSIDGDRIRYAPLYCANNPGACDANDVLHAPRTVTGQDSITYNVNGDYGAVATFNFLLPVLTLSKTADAGSVAAGMPIGFSITVANTGTAAAQNVTLTDVLPTGSGIAWSISPAVTGCAITAGTLTCTWASLAAGASVTVHVTSPTTTSSCGTYTNGVTLDATGLPTLNASATTAVDCTCTRTIGFWKTHAGFGPQADVVTQYLPIWLGSAGGPMSVQVTTAGQAVTLLSMSGNASNPVNKLYAQLLGAKLNLAAGANGSAVAAVIAAADAFLANANASTVLTKAERQQVLAWMTTLDDYNNGLIGPSHCE